MIVQSPELTGFGDPFYGRRNHVDEVGDAKRAANWLRT